MEEGKEDKEDKEDKTFVPERHTEAWQVYQSRKSVPLQCRPFPQSGNRDEWIRSEMAERRNSGWPHNTLYWAERYVEERGTAATFIVKNPEVVGCCRYLRLHIRGVDGKVQDDQVQDKIRQGPYWDCSRLNPSWLAEVDSDGYLQGQTSNGEFMVTKRPVPAPRSMLGRFCSTLGKLLIWN